MSKTAIDSPELTPPIGPFSQAIKVDGFLFLGSQVGQDPTTGKLTPGGVVEEAPQLFSNAAAVLRAADLGFDNVVSARPPAVCVAALPLGAYVEIGMIAKP